uniref:7TM GPCR serpentine receptor class x (Srx) domain-containing protein n=1 Tax=Caenorhabditis japonica TaxID=281687 RepID=A0A8R1HI04_CAEJA
MFFTKAAIFNSNYMSWFFNPFLPDHEASNYVNMAHAINNCIVSAVTTIIYVYLCLFLFAKSKQFRSESISKTQTQIFFQSVLICTFNAFAAYIYVYMQFFYSPPLVILVGQLAWQFSHGSVCLVYITMNRTIRRGVINLVVPRAIRDKVRIGTNNTTTVTRPTLSFVGADARSKRNAATSSGTMF